MNSVEFSRDVNVRHEVDVCILGGGPSGCAAGIAAARCGAKVLLIEENGCLGGLGTAGLVPAYMCFGDGENILAAGIGWEILERLWALGGDEYSKHNFSIRAEALKRVYEDMLTEAGTAFTLCSRVIGINMHGKCIDSVIIAGRSDLYAVKAKTFIDSTGDAIIAKWAGAPCEMGDENGKVMASTLCSLWSDIDFTRTHGRDDRALERAFADGVFERPDRHLSGIWRVGKSVGGGNIGHVYDVDGTDERSLTDGLIYTRKLYDEYVKYYREYLPGYENIELVATGNMLGVRETRRIVGEYTLSLDDFRKRAEFPDEIGRFCYPVDIHASDSSAESHAQFEKEFYNLRYGKGESYGIPYRCLVPKGVDNLLVAGRCISTDRYMQSSVRVIPGCYITGQAAGVAAANTHGAVRGVDVSKVREILRGWGMLLKG